MTRMDNMGEKFTIKSVNEKTAMWNAVWVTPGRRAFRDMAFILFLSSAVSWPAKAGSAL